MKGLYKVHVGFNPSPSILNTPKSLTKNVPYTRACILGTMLDIRGWGVVTVRGKGFHRACGCPKSQQSIAYFGSPSPTKEAARAEMYEIG